MTSARLSFDQHHHHHRSDDFPFPTMTTMTTMTTSRDAPNPLRPYYIPPSIGLPQDSPAVNVSRPSPSSAAAAISSKPSIGSQARDILSDLDYADYLSDTNPTVADMARRLLDQAVWNYTTVLLAQPFEVAKTLLQVHLPPTPPGLAALGVQATPSYASDSSRSRPSSYASGKYEDYPSESDSENESYFTSTAPRPIDPYAASDRSHSRSRSPNHRRRQHPSRSSSVTVLPAHHSRSYKLELRRSDSVLEVLGQLWAKESAWGLWKGSNATFVYNFLLRTIENWSRSLLSALLNLPDPGMTNNVGGVDVLDSPNPILSLGVAIAAAGIAGLVLAPLDIVRTRLILTPTTSTPRNILPSLRALPSLTVPAFLLPVTLLHSILPAAISAASPLLLRSSLSIDPTLTPTAFSLASFLSSAVELFVKLPLETVLRRGQASYLRDTAEEQRRREAYTTLKSNSSSSSHHGSPAEHDPSSTGFKTIVDVGPYKGLWGTMWFIVREEGLVLLPPSAAAAGRTPSPGRMPMQKVRKGQGMKGLVRGWRVGFWGLVGVWGASALGGGSGGEF